MPNACVCVCLSVTNGCFPDVNKVFGIAPDQSSTEDVSHSAPAVADGHDDSLPPPDPIDFPPLPNGTAPAPQAQLNDSGDPDLTPPVSVESGSAKLDPAASTLALEQGKISPKVIY